jgi:anti-anti-sigma regulatory factor
MESGAEYAMTYIMVTEEDRTTFLLEGQAVDSPLQYFNQDLLQQIEDGKSKILIDFSRVTFVDVGMLDILMKATRKLLPARKTPVLVITDKTVLRAFYRNGINRVFPIYENYQEARASLGESA